MGYRVMVIEDGFDMAETITAYLELHGVEVIWCRTLAEARYEYDPGIFDVLLVDYDLPDGTGIDFLTDADREEAWAILWSGLDRSRELEAAALDRVTLASKVDMPEVLAKIIAARDEAVA